MLFPWTLWNVANVTDEIVEHHESNMEHKQEDRNETFAYLANSSTLIFSSSSVCLGREKVSIHFGLELIGTCLVLNLSMPRENLTKRLSDFEFTWLVSTFLAPKTSRMSTMSSCIVYLLSFVPVQS